jgi:hypothetical protein
MATASSEMARIGFGHDELVLVHGSAEEVRSSLEAAEGPFVQFINAHNQAVFIAVAHVKHVTSVGDRGPGVRTG